MLFLLKASLKASLKVLASVSHTLAIERITPVPASCGVVTVKEVGLGMTPKSVSFKAVV